MRFYRTIDNGELLRIEDEYGAAITLSVYDHVARILSVYVQEDDRREGAGTALLDAAKQEAVRLGCSVMEADISGKSSEVISFLEKNGFSIEKHAPVYKVAMKDFFSSRIMSTDVSKAEGSTLFVPLSGLDVPKWREILSSISSLRMPIGSNYLSRFSQTYSGAFYQKSGSLMALALASEKEGSLQCDFIVFPDCNDAFLPSVFYEYLVYIRDTESERSYSGITVLVSDMRIADLIQAIYDKKKKEPLMHTRYCRKVLTKEDTGADITDEYTDWDGSHDIWLDEVSYIPLQENIVWKLPWQRYTDNVDDENDADVVIPYDKQEDERSGLLFDDTRRITSDAIPAYKKYLSIDERQNLKRPFFHGLVLRPDKDKEPEALLLYELRNQEKDEDVVSRITALRFQNREAGEKILAEYTNEVASQNAVSTSFSLSELSDEQWGVLEDAGFILERRASNEFVITVDQFLEDKILMSVKADPSIVPLSSIDQRQFWLGINSSVSSRGKNTLQDILYLPKEWYENDISCAIVQDNRVYGFLLFHKESKHKLIPVFLLSMREDVSKDILLMIAFSAKAIGERYSTQTQILVRKQTREVKNLLDKVYPNAPEDIIVFGERVEEG